MDNPKPMIYDHRSKQKMNEVQDLYLSRMFLKIVEKYKVCSSVEPSQESVLM